MPAGKTINCPKCGEPVEIYRNPALTVDIIIHMTHGIILIERKNPPYGWALPGGFVDYGESLEAAAYREAKEETGVDLDELQQFRAYSDPARDPRQHTVTVVFFAQGRGLPVAADDAQRLAVFPLDSLPSDLAFDHQQILGDYVAWSSAKLMLKQ
ncbi:NUDIX hydrolase [Desulfoferrobacter suflitae]|uniref:NUDIX hydrolase n=1 Tax=Desulfoferrobacter suflitae TaxID=2865782 RepID=UPI002164C27D|nr:NUDIX hydrolase [Desulfoferrobacter suflitae]MCK8601401.1 NUDIX hydrolase [Desulfoferrobacter suflitae]